MAAGAAAASAAVAGAVDSAVLAAAARAGEGLPVAGNNRVAGDNMDLLKELVEKLEHAFSDRLVSVILYGSAASPAHADRLSDLNVLCVLKEVMPRELMEGETVLNWWREKGHPWPLLMSEDEVHNSADSFPIEFHDMKERRRVLYGLDVIADLKVDMRNYRTQVEHELRSKLLRLRHLAEVLQADMKPFEILLDIREDVAGAAQGDIGDPGELFAQYLVCINRLITFVDALDGQRG